MSRSLYVSLLARRKMRSSKCAGETSRCPRETWELLPGSSARTEQGVDRMFHARDLGDGWRILWRCLKRLCPRVLCGGQTVWRGEWGIVWPPVSVSRNWPFSVEPQTDPWKTISGWPVLSKPIKQFWSMHKTESENGVPVVEAVSPPHTPNDTIYLFSNFPTV